MPLLWKEQKKSKGAHLHIEASAHSHYACEKSNIWPFVYEIRNDNRLFTTGGHQKIYPNRFLHLCAIVSFSFLLKKHEWIFGFRYNAPGRIPDLTRFTAWRMWCERKSGHDCGFWYQGRPERRLTWNETGKESHFTFGIGSLLIAFYCILMCADDDDDDDDIKGFVCLYINIRQKFIKITWINQSVTHVNLISNAK